MAPCPRCIPPLIWNQMGLAPAFPLSAVYKLYRCMNGWMFYHCKPNISSEHIQCGHVRKQPAEIGFTRITRKSITRIVCHKGSQFPSVLRSKQATPSSLTLIFFYRTARQIEYSWGKCWIRLFSQLVLNWEHHVKNTYMAIRLGLIKCIRLNDFSVKTTGWKKKENIHRTIR